MWWRQWEDSVKHILWKLARHLSPRKRKSWDEVSTPILLVLGLLATMEAGYYGYVLQKFAPDFLDLANGLPVSTWLNTTFLACAMILSGIGFQFFIWSIAAAGSVALLQKRVFGI
jgi:hypothetical protein